MAFGDGAPLSELERRFTGPIPPPLLAAWRAGCSERRLAQARGRAIIALLERQLAGHSHMTGADRRNAGLSLAAWREWLAGREDEAATRQ